MKIIRNGEVIIANLDEVVSGEEIVCDNFEELIRVCRDVGHYIQCRPLVVKIL